MFSGTVRVRDRLRFGSGLEGQVTAVAVFERGPAVQRHAVSAGQIGKLWGLAAARVGDPLGAAAGRGPSSRRRRWSPPSSRAIPATGTGCESRSASWPSRIP